MIADHGLELGPADVLAPADVHVLEPVDQDHRDGIVALSDVARVRYQPSGVAAEVVASDWIQYPARVPTWGALDGVFRELQVSRPHPRPLPLRRPHPGPGARVDLGCPGWGVQGTAGQQAALPHPHPRPHRHRHRRPLPHPGRGLVRASTWGALDGVFRAPQVSGSRPHPSPLPLRLRRPHPHPGPGPGARVDLGRPGRGVQGTTGQRAAPAPAPASSPPPAPPPASGVWCARRSGVPWMGCSGHCRSADRARTRARSAAGRGWGRASTWGALDGGFRAPQVSGPHPLSGAARPCSHSPVRGVQYCRTPNIQSTP